MDYPYFRGMVQKPLSERQPLIRIWLYLMICTSYFKNIAIQLSSHNSPMKISEPLFKLRKLNASFTFVVSLLESGRLAFLVGVITRQSATSALGLAVFSMFVQITKSCLVV